MDLWLILIGVSIVSFILATFTSWFIGEDISLTVILLHIVASSIPLLNWLIIGGAIVTIIDELVPSITNVFDRTLIKGRVRK